jgi:hypothetical protein
MTNDDIAIAAQMRAWLVGRHADWSDEAKEMTDVGARAAEREIELRLAIAHLDTLTSKRWRVVDVPLDDTLTLTCGEIVSWGLMSREGEAPVIGGDAMRVEPGSKLLIVTEEK